MSKIKLGKSGKKISERLYGIFLEDINFAVDGGLNANMVNNYSFDGVYMNADLSPNFDPLRYWIANDVILTSEKEGGISEKSAYAKVSVKGKGNLFNLGYNGNKENAKEPAMNIKTGDEYEFSCYIKSDNYVGTVAVCVVSSDGSLLTTKERVALTADWSKAELKLVGNKDAYGKLCIEFDGEGEVCIDSVCLYGEYLGKGDNKWSGGRFRKDLVVALKNLSPKFMRFPGGCIVEGTVPKNEYNWKETVGKLEDRTEKYCLWGEKVPDGGYCQSNQIGFYEYFCLCEELNAEPLPILTAGINCQARAFQRHEKVCPNVPISSTEFEKYIVGNYLDLIDFANGEKGTSKWADLRVEMGHEKPFGMKMIGIGNENYGKDYLERFRIIKEAINKKAPEIECVHCSGLGIFEYSVNKMRKHVAKNYCGVLVDEHKYRPAICFFNLYDYFDKAKRQLGDNKIYYGEYAANVVLKKNATIKDYNKWGTALAESVFLLGIEKNADVVEMCSYAPLFNLVTSLQWTHNLIDFNPKTYIENANYKLQKLFAANTGNEYVPFVGKLKKGVYLSETKRGKEHFIKVVNASKRDEFMEIDVPFAAKSFEIITLGGDLNARNDLEFFGNPIYEIEESFKTQEFNKTITFDAKSGKVYVIKIREE